MLFIQEWNTLERRWRMLTEFFDCVESVLNSMNNPVEKIHVLHLVCASLHETDEDIPMNVINLVLGELHLTGELPPYEELVKLTESSDATR